MTDYFGFTMAALNESGSVFANPCKGDNNMSTLMYRPFSSWAGNSEVRFFASNINVLHLQELECFNIAHIYWLLKQGVFMYVQL